MPPPKVSIDSAGVMTITTKVDSVDVYMKLKDRYQEAIRRVETTQTVEVNKLTWWQQLWCALGKILSVALLIQMFFTIKRFL